MFLLLALAPAPAGAVARWQPFIDEASARFGIPASWIERVMRAESGGYDRMHGRPIRSSKGAVGLMQLMPATWAEVRAALALGLDADDPRDNILAGAFYLRRMYDRFGYPGCFAAYNAGPGRYAAWLAGSATLPRETIGYLATVQSDMPPVAPDPSRPVASDLFVIRRQAGTAAPSSAQDQPMLFDLRESPK